MRHSTRSLARASAAHPKRVLALWGVALLVSLGAIGALLGSSLTTEGQILSNPESERGYALIAERIPPSGDYVNEIVSVHSETLKASAPAFRAKVDELANAIRAIGVTQSVASYFDNGDPSYVSRDRDTVLITIGMAHDPEGNIGKIVDLVEKAAEDGFRTTITGEWTADRDFVQLSNEDLEQGELYFGLPAALIVLLLVVGSVVAGLVPVALALAAIIVALGLTALVGQATDLSFYVVNMISGMGLALGIDYSLFVVSRFREERRHGRGALAAIETSGATASRAVFFSGSAFVLAMFGMVLVPDTILRSLAVGAILVGVVAVAGALTLLPAVLALLGDRVNALRVPWLGRIQEQTAGAEGRVWARLVRRVMRHPWVSVTACVAILLLCAAPVLDMTTGLTGIRSLPDRFPAKEGFLALEREFGVGTVDTALIVVDADASSPDVKAALRRLESRLRASPIFRPPEVTVGPGGDVTVLETLVAGDSRDERTIQAVERLRTVDVPAAFEGTDARVYVTGETAEVIDYRDLASRWLPIVFVFVLALSFVLLTVAFRSVVVPAKAIVLNLLSVGAAYGLLVLVFQKGVGNELFGFQQVDVIAAWLPLFLFSVLFGLSMDYHVFLLSRIRERYTQTGDTSEAVAYGVGSTARLITGAAAIIIAVFAGFAAGDLVEFQQMGFGIAVSLLVDATIIRTILLPASMKLLGEWNWYLPAWLEWLPHLEIEAPPDEQVAGLGAE